MAAVEVGSRPNDIHSKYEIKRTTYKKEDLEALSNLLEVRFLHSFLKIHGHKSHEGY